MDLATINADPLAAGYVAAISVHAWRRIRYGPPRRHPVRPCKPAHRKPFAKSNRGTSSLQNLVGCRSVRAMLPDWVRGSPSSSSRTSQLM